MGSRALVPKRKGWGLVLTMLLGFGAVLPLMSLTGCGGVSPAEPVPAPTAPPVVNVTLLDGVTGASLAGMPSPVGAPLDVQRAGYLPRLTLVPRDGAVFLWPITVDQAWSLTLVYHEFSPARRLVRWTRAELTISPEFPQAALDEINSTGAVRLRYGTPADIDSRVDPQRLPTATANAAASITFTGDTITHATILLRDEGRLQNVRTARHELGHALGFGHSSRHDDLMWPVNDGGGSFTHDERVLLVMMYGHRRPGNAAPDNDVALGAASGAVRTIMVVD